MNLRLLAQPICFLLLTGLLASVAVDLPATEFKVGTARREITPEKPVPLWGYGVRHGLLSQGVMDPLWAKAVVIDSGGRKLAIVGVDLGRAPPPDAMQRIRQTVHERAGVDYLMICASHTHNGPVIELRDQPGEGRGTYDDAVAYALELEGKLIAVICEAAAGVQDARLGWASTIVDRNRNRHSRTEPKPLDPELVVIRLDSISGKPIALVVNFAAHPTMLDKMERRFSADYPGWMSGQVERATGAMCMFVQGAVGDLSPKTTDQTSGSEAFGKALAADVLTVAERIETSIPNRPAIEVHEETFTFPTRLNFDNPLLLLIFQRAFFPELANAVLHQEIQNNTLRPQLTTVLLNGELALVGVSGEFFAEHATRLKAQSPAKKTLLLSCCNGHQMYFPTLKAVAEGGYGADPMVSWVEPGAGEHMIDRALSDIRAMLELSP